MSSQGPVREGKPERSAAERETRLGLADLDRWRPADKSFLVSVFVCGLVVYSIMLLWYAVGHTADMPFLDPDVLTLQFRGSIMLLGLWVLLGGLSLAMRKRSGRQRFFVHAPIQLFAISNSTIAYAMGPFTSPFGPVVLLGGILASLPLFGTGPTLFGAVSWLTVGALLIGAEQLGSIPYGPLFTSLPLVDGRLSPEYLIGIGSITAVGILLCAVVSITAIRQLQAREIDLQKSGENLVASIVELNRSHTAVARAKEELETRVQHRTAELRTANEKLRTEVLERKRGAEALETLQIAMEAAIEGVAFVGLDGRFREVNGAFAAIHHAEPKAMIGTVADDWVDATQRGKIAAAVAELDRGAKRELTLSGIRPDDTQFSLELALVGAEPGTAISHYRFARDVTEQERVAAQLNHTTKMEAVGRLVGGIAHDFNNLLTAILAASEQLENRFAASPEDADSFELAHMTRMAGTRAAELTRQLLDFAHLKPARDDLIDVERSIRNSIHLLESAVDASVRIVTDLADEPLITRGDAARFDSGLLNLELNARDAMPHGGEITISTERVRLSPTELGIRGSEMEWADFAKIQIVDTGIGIEAGNLTKIFEPFFTTKPLGKGTGLGLSVFDRYIREIGGALQIDSTPGQGTVCSVFAPLSDSDLSEVAEARGRGSIEGGELVLLAEDEPAVMRVLTMMLERAGYSVIPCSDGGDAVAMFTENHMRVAAALLDFRMPVMNGAEVFFEFQRIAPDVPVLLMSGNLADADLEELVARGLYGVIEKPYTQTRLLGTLREALNAKAQSG